MGLRYKCAKNAATRDDMVEEASLPNHSVFMIVEHAQMSDSNGTPRRILLLSPFFFPELISTGKANTHLAQALAAHGAEVSVVCSHPLYPDWIPVRSDAPLSGVTILRDGAWVRYPKRMSLRRAVLEGWFAGYAAYHAWRLRRRVDVVVGVFPPSLFALGTHFLLPRRVRRVAVVHDLQGVLAGQHESALRRGIARLIHAVESRVFHAQDRCIFFSADMAQVARESYGLDAEKVAVQYPFVTIERWSAAGTTEPESRLQHVLPSGQAHVVYSGALGFKQNSEILVRWMQTAAQRFSGVQFHVFSGGPIFDKLRARAASLADMRVHFHPLVEERDLPELYARSTIQLVPQAEKTEAGALPSKLPNLLAAGIYTLAITSASSEVARLLREAKTGSVVERWEEPLFLARLEEALQQAQAVSAAERQRQTQALLSRFTVENMVQLIVGAEQSAAGEKA